MTPFVKWDQYWDSKDMINVEGHGEFNVYSTKTESDFIMICIHGAGHSGLSFSLLAEKMRTICSVIAPDLKCHGDTRGDESQDLSIDKLTRDVAALCEALNPEDKKLIILGHSLGGSIATRAISHIKPKPVCLVVLDTIEGVAMVSMPRMKSILSGRPSSFNTEGEAVRYVSSSGEMNNSKSAAASLPGRLIKDGNVYKWRTNLLPSEPFWNDWFLDFADAFIKAPTYKILILPDVDRLDKPFTIGHMSGKFQLEIVQGSCHCIHEDKPDDIARIVKNFIRRLSDSYAFKK